MRKMDHVIMSVASGTAVMAVFMGVFMVSVVDDRQQAAEIPAPPTLDKEDYDRRMRALAGVEEPRVQSQESRVESQEGFGNREEGVDSVAGEAEKPLWPVDAAYPNYGALLPFNRIVAYYGNFYSRRMGVLGEYDRPVMIEKFRAEIEKWNEADPETPVMPAIDYIAVTAQLAPGRDGMYRLRMPHDQIDYALELAEEIEGIVILEVQPGLAEPMDEIRELEDYLKMPNVHLAIDPEFVMKYSGARPGSRVGMVTADDVNAAAEYLAELVRENDLPPKILLIHRYTRAMVKNATEIVPLPEVQVIMDMDGWGPKAQKFATYNAFIVPEPVQFTGFKLFYKNDVWTEGSTLLTPEEILELKPKPIFIQYQ